MDTLFGEFNNTGIHVDIYNNKDEYDVAATSLHELCHQKLSSNSYIGVFDFLLTNICKACNDEKTKSKIVQLYNRVSNSSIRVQESVAMFTELAFLKVINNDKYVELFNYYTNKSDSYKNYKFKDLQFLLNNLENVEEALNVTKKIEYIALLAMNIKIFEMNPLDGKCLKQIDKAKEKYNANVRFSKIIKYIKDNSIDLKACREKQIQDIFNENSLEYQEFSWDEFKTWADNKLLKPLNFNSVESYIHYSNNASLPIGLLSASAYNSSKKHITHHTCKNLDQVNKVIPESQILFIANSDNCANVRYILVNYEKKESYEFYGVKVFTELFNHIPIVFTDRNHYSNLVEMEPQIKKEKILVDLADMSDQLIEFIKNVGVKEYFIDKLNNQFVVIFMKGDNNVIFFHMTSLLVASYLIPYVLSDYKLTKEWWNDVISMEALSHFKEFLLLR